MSAKDLAASCERLYGEHTYTAHRADLLAAIGSQVPANTVRMGHKCVGYDTGGEMVQLGFADGGSAAADVLIGAGGAATVRGDPHPPHHAPPGRQP